MHALGDQDGWVIEVFHYFNFGWFQGPHFPNTIPEPQSRQKTKIRNLKLPPQPQPSL